MIKKFVNEIFNRQFNLLDLMITSLAAIQFSRGNYVLGTSVLVVGVVVVFILERVLIKK